MMESIVIDIETFQIASAVFCATSIGLAHTAYGLAKRLASANLHVANLQEFAAEQAVRIDGLIVKNAELNGIVTKVHNQRQRALDRAVAANKARAEARRVGQQEAAKNTLDALASTPLRPREEVVAGIRKPEPVSNAG
jgi:hypothetical protein